MTETLTNGFDSDNNNKSPSNGLIRKSKRKRKLQNHEDAVEETPTIANLAKRMNSLKNERNFNGGEPLEMPSSEILKKLSSPVVDVKKVKVIPAELQIPSSSLAEESVTFKKMKKGQKNEGKVEDMAMEERLKTITEEQKSRKKQQRQGSVVDSSVMLLTQALHSQDNSNLEKVFKERSSKVIKSTVSQLPIQLVLPLLQSLQTRMRNNPQNHQYMGWLKETLCVHASYLSSSFETKQELVELREFMGNRTEFVERLTRLRGKLALLKNQLQNRVGSGEARGQEPKLLFEDESSDSESEDDERRNEEGATSDDQTDGDLELDWWEDVEKAAEEEDSDDDDKSESSDSDEDSILGNKKKDEEEDAEEDMEERFSEEEESGDEEDL